ncbi:MAG: hypothetical protein KC708_18690 [Anaerolineae bacterium]|nr:hypothetical protein [Anaerolineae bacterium]
MDDISTHTLAESDSYAIWTTVEDDGETIYHFELGSVTLHFFKEEWDELTGLIQAAANGGGSSKKRR